MLACDSMLSCQHTLPRLQAGLGVAARYANELGVDWIWERVQELATELRSRLESIPGVTVHDRGRLLCGIVSFTKVSSLMGPYAPHQCIAQQLMLEINVDWGSQPAMTGVGAICMGAGGGAVLLCCQKCHSCELACNNLKSQLLAGWHRFGADESAPAGKEDQCEHIAIDLHTIRL